MSWYDRIGFHRKQWRATTHTPTQLLNRCTKLFWVVNKLCKKLFPIAQNDRKETRVIFDLCQPPKGAAIKNSTLTMYQCTSTRTRALEVDGPLLRYALGNHLLGAHRWNFVVWSRVWNAYNLHVEELRFQRLLYLVETILTYNYDICFRSPDHSIYNSIDLQILIMSDRSS